VIFINTNVVDMSLNNEVVNKNASVNKKLKIVLICACLVLFVLAIVGGILFINSFQKTNRTIMIYMVGSDLESENKIATYDLDDINPDNIDLENNNVLLIVGGSTKWHNYVSEDEVAIYKLEEDGFDKIVTYELSSMGESKILTKFLNFSHNHYRAKKYDLIFWNHGIGAYGIESDEIYDDYLTITELKKGLEKSPFSKEEKFESVLFINCLSGNLHFADVMSDYANYMIGSEEVSYGSVDLNKLDFLEKIEVDDTGYDYGVKFIDNLSSYVDEYNDRAYRDIDSTYSVIDLSKIDEVISKLNDVVSRIDVSDNYRGLSKLRGSLVTYGKENKSYDMVDLYALVYGMKGYASMEDINDLLMTIKNSVVYNWSLNGYSYGLSVYFPYYGTDYQINLHLNELKEISNDEYFSFVSNFFISKKGYLSNLNISKNLGKATFTDFNLLLEEEQIEEYSHSSVVVLKDMKDGYYMPLYTSSDTSLNENRILNFNYKGKALKVIDKNDGSSSIIYLSEKSRNEKYVEYLTFAMLQDLDGNSVVAEVYIIVDENHPNGYISKIVKSDDVLPSMVILDINYYTDMFFTNYKYDIFDDSGKYVDNWQSEGTSYLFKVNVDNYEFELFDVDSNDYYCIFKVYDVNNEVHYSSLIPIK